MQRVRLLAWGMVFLAAGMAASFCRAAGAPPDTDGSSDAQVARLIEQLGDDHYSVRQRAQAELIKLGSLAFDALSAAEENDDLEIAEQARYLVRMIRVDVVRDNDPQSIKTYLEDYESQDQAARLLMIHQVANLPDGEGLEVLCRIIRFEKSAILSKQTAAAILNRFDKLQPSLVKQRQTLLDALDRSARPGAKWIRVLLQSTTDPQGAADQWGKLADEEFALFERAPQESGEYLVDALWRRQVASLSELKRRPEALAVMRKVIGLEKGNPSSLASLVDWLVKQQAWELVEDVSKRFEGAFQKNIILIYTLAEARAAQGNSQAAEEAAKTAFQLNRDHAGEHLKAAAYLRDRGLFPWSEREYRDLISQPLGPQAAVQIQARLQVAEVFHDQERDKEAGEVLQGVIDGIQKFPTLKEFLRQTNREPGTVVSRMHFFWSEHYRSIKDTKQQKERLDLAIQSDPQDADVLIGLYHLPDQTPAEQKRTRELIKNAVNQFHNLLEAEGDNPNTYNELAWLIGNTEGDFDEAIQASKKSIELLQMNAPEVSIGGFLDTLAHCYAGKHDYDNAVACQMRAVEYDPHSQQIKRALEQFRAAAAAQPKADKP